MGQERQRGEREMSNKFADSNILFIRQLLTHSECIFSLLFIAVQCVCVSKLKFV